MSEPLVIQSLQEKRAEILGRIAAYQAQIAQAQHDLAHINAAIRLFAEPEQQRARYLVSHGFFRKGEVADICVRHLRAGEEIRPGARGAGDARGQLEPRNYAEKPSSSRSCRPSATRTDAGWCGWSRSARGCASGAPAMPSRCALPIALPGPTDRSVRAPAISRSSSAPLL